jgi:peptidyl-prolyl cis-trans isomerase SurA
MKTLTLLLAAALALGAPGAFAQTRDLSATGQPLDRIVAVVNEGVVLQSEVDGQVALIMARLREQGGQMPPERVIRQQVLERLVLQEIQLQRAKRLGVTVADEMLNNALRDVAQRNNVPFDQMPALLAAQGMDYATYRDDMRREVTLSLLRQRDVLPRIYVSPRELEQALEREAAQADLNAEYDVSHILLSLPESATADEIAAVEARAEEVYRRAAAGEDFGQLALSFSQAQSALERGKLGWRRPSQLPQFIAEQVATLEPGQVSRPVRTPTGFHLVKLDGERGGDAPMMVEQVNARHILLKPTEVQDDATTRQRLADLRQRILDGEDFAALASVTSEDPGSATQGGDLGWTGPGTFVPQFEQALNGLEEGEISEPFRTQFGCGRAGRHRARSLPWALPPGRGRPASCCWATGSCSAARARLLGIDVALPRLAAWPGTHQRAGRHRGPACAAGKCPPGRASSTPPTPLRAGDARRPWPAACRGRVRRHGDGAGAEERHQRRRHPVPGHTEFLAQRPAWTLPVMMLVAEGLRVALATTHLPLAAVPGAITAPLLDATLTILDRDLRQRFHRRAAHPGAGTEPARRRIRATSAGRRSTR